MRQLAILTFWIFVFTVPWQNTVLVVEVGTISQAVGVVAFVAAILACLSEAKVRRPDRTLLLAAAFVLYAATSILWSQSSEITVPKVMTLAQLFLMLWVSSELIADGSQIQSLMSAYVLGALVGALAILWQVASGNADQDARFAAQGFNPNDQALTLALAIPMCFRLAGLRTHLWLNLLYIGYLIAAPAAIAVTGSRAGALAAVAAFGVSLLGLRGGVRRSKRAMLIAIVAAGAFCAIAFVPEASWGRLSTIGEQVSAGDLNRRTTVWAAGAKGFMTHPLLGVGEGAFLQVREVRWRGHGCAQHVHVRAGGAGAYRIHSVFALDRKYDAGDSADEFGCPLAVGGRCDNLVRGRVRGHLGDAKSDVARAGLHRR